MKAGTAHTVPLSVPAYEILSKLNAFRVTPLVFPHLDSRMPPSVNAPRALLKRMNLDITLHGFRASFKSWATDRTVFQRKVIEMSLAHKIGNEVEQSYLKTTAFNKRSHLMQAWQTTATVTIKAMLSAFMHSHVQTCYIESSELTDIFDCVILCARGRYWFEQIRPKESLKSLDDVLIQYFHSNRIHVSSPFIEYHFDVRFMGLVGAYSGTDAA